MKLIISGVARSGTTLVFESLSRALGAALGDSLEYRYEPYLWNVESPVVAGQSFGTETIDTEGVYVHTHTPLFLTGRHELHDAWLASRLHLGRQDKSTLIKVIRGGGRLESYLSFDQVVKVLAVVRNPIDTINSVRARFSFFGTEFHPSDEPRLLEEAGKDEDEAAGSYVMRALRWWSAMTDEAQRVARAYPDRVICIPYEWIVDDPVAPASELQDWLGNDLGAPEKLFHLEKPSGPTTSASYLSVTEVRQLEPALDKYVSDALVPAMGSATSSEIQDDILDSYEKRVLSARIHVPAEDGRTAVQLRAQLSRGEPRSLGEGYIERLRAAAGVVTANELDTSTPFDRPAPGSPTVGLVLATHGDEATIEATLLSAVNQTRPFDEIVVVDDHSNDRTPLLVDEFASLHAGVRVVRNNSQTGPAFARDVGIRELATDFFSTVDGDDMLWPTKNAEEMRMVASSPRAIGFSDIATEFDDRTGLVDTSAYEGPSSHVLENMLQRTPGIPRDLTMRRELYFEAGGFDIRLSLFEDWDFKIRLAGLEGAIWKRSGAPLGTLYNRRSAGLSQRSLEDLARNVIWILHKNRHLYSGSNDEFGRLAGRAVSAIDPPFDDQFQSLMRSQPWLIGLKGGVFDSREFLAASGAEVARLITQLDKRSA